MAQRTRSKVYKVQTRNSTYYVLVIRRDTDYKSAFMTKCWRANDGLFFFSEHEQQIRIGARLYGDNGNRKYETSPIVSVDRISMQQFKAATT